MAGNIRNIRTTHPKKRARRQGAMDRFSVKFGASKEYMASKEIELSSLARSLGADRLDTLNYVK